MIVFWGSYALNKVLNYLFPVGFCGFCNYHGEMKCVTTARLAHFMFIPLFVFNREYFLICPNCENTIKISKKDFKNIKNGTWQPPAKDETLHVLNKDEVFEKIVAQEVTATIYAKSKQLKNPEKQQAASAQIRKSFANKYKNNATVEKIVNDLLADAVETSEK